MEIAEYNKLVDEGLSEYAIQCKVVIHLKSEYPNALFTISPQGMKLPIGVAKKIKAMGYNKGTPDLIIFESRKSYLGLAIELKTVKKYHKSDEQIKWIDDLNNRNYKAVFCCGFEEAKKVIDEYFATK